MASIHRVSWTLKNGEVREAYRVSYWLAGKKKFRQFATKRKAHAFTETLHIHKGKELARERERKRLTVAEAAALWIADCRKRLRPDTVTWYEGVLRNHVLDHLGTRALSSDMAGHFRDLLADSKIVKMRTVLIAFTRWCVEEGICDVSLVPGRARKGHADHAPGARKQRRRAPPPSDVARLRKAAADLALRSPNWKKWAAFLDTLVFTGMRLSEVRALTWGAVDVAEGLIEVRQSADKAGRFHACKTAQSHRTIDIPHDLATTLDATKPAHHTSKDRLVFGTRNNTALQVKTIRRNFVAPLEAESGQKVWLHGLRHYYASRLVHGGFNVLEVSRMMGHSDPAFTLRVYGHMFDDKASRADRRRRVNQLTYPVHPESPGTPGSGASSPPA